MATPISAERIPTNPQQRDCRAQPPVLVDLSKDNGKAEPKRNGRKAQSVDAVKMPAPAAERQGKSRCLRARIAQAYSGSAGMVEIQAHVAKDQAAAAAVARAGSECLFPDAAAGIECGRLHELSG